MQFLYSTLSLNALRVLYILLPGTPAHTNTFLTRQRSIQPGYMLHVASLLNNYKHDIKQTWKVLRPLIGKQSDKMSVVDKFLVNDQVIMEPNEISNKFCDFFCQYRKRHPGPNREYFKPLGGNIFRRYPKEG